MKIITQSQNRLFYQNTAANFENINNASQACTTPAMNKRLKLGVTTGHTRIGFMRQALYNNFIYIYLAYA
ncbi:MAG: hypothetical protein Q7U57_02430 [Methylovulum sp.]|nr:hypothetical protein [Methylovulum sp.]